ncbi:AhpC/TSA family protein [Streptomyces iakyrus]|uniref:AhpC/TSA family protein n=1 Tax=Streptomyces iakyrus TaxID=68219 RepID=UPI003827DBA3
MCHLHLRSVVRRHAEIEAAGVREVVVFHSPAEELLRHTADLPFAVVADPGKRLYAEFGVESAPRALLSPRAWGPVVGAVLRGGWEVLRGRERLPATRQPGGRLGLPADFLIGTDGRILAAKYGEHVYDQWPVDEILRLASSHRPAAGRLPAG